MSRRGYSFDTGDGVVDLSAIESANCYIVEQAGTYKFRTTKGNSAISVGEAYSVSILWESFGNTITPNVGDLISDVYYNDGYVTFTATNAKGNAVIAVKDSNNEILWSWHIWLTDYPNSYILANNAGIWMDRNLGATSIIVGDITTLGTYYQWGRKDPFLSNDHHIKTSNAWPLHVVVNANVGTVDYATKHPTTFIANDPNTNTYNWNYSADPTLWGEEKTIYDPSPSGWKIARHTVMENCNIISSTRNFHNQTYKGHIISHNGNSIWLPFGGTLGHNYNAVSSFEIEIYHWFATSYSSGFARILSGYQSAMYVHRGGKTAAIHCRPIKDTSSPIWQQ